jgi:hypothetical protein
MGLVGSYAPCPFVIQLLPGRGRIWGSTLYTGHRRLALGRVSLWRNWSVFRVRVGV